MLNDDKTLFAIFGTPQKCAKLGLSQMEVGEIVVCNLTKKQHKQQSMLL